MVFGENKLVFIVSLIWHDFFLWEFILFWKIPSNSVVSDCMTSTIPHILVISVLGISLFNSKIYDFQIHFVNFYRRRRKLQRIAAIMLQAIPSFYTKTSRKSLYIYKNIWKVHCVCKNYWITHHNDKVCFLPACKNHITLLREVEELRHILDTFCFTYQHVDCLYTLFKYPFRGKSIAESGNVFHNVQRAIFFNQRVSRVDKKPAFVKKEALEKKAQTASYDCSAKEQFNADISFSVCRKNGKKQERLNLK